MDTHEPSLERPPLLVSKRDACIFLGGICMRTLEKLIVEKQLPVRHIGRRIFVPYSALVAFTRQRSR
jgi:hypothetical protein